MDVVVRHQTAQEICATWGAVVIRICDGNRTEIADLDRVSALFDELLEHKPAVGMLLVFCHGTPLPTPTTQRHAQKSMQRYAKSLVLAVAMLGLGFWASAFRASLNLLTRFVSTGPMVLEGTVESAATCLADELIGIDPDALVAVYRQLWDRLQHEQTAS